jgi:hypothetical protein
MAYRNRTIPDSDKGVRRFVYGFSRGVAAQPETYGFDAERAAELVILADELIGKSITAIRPGSRTPVAVRAKNDCKKRVLAVFRAAVNEIKANPAVEDWQRVNLDIVVEKSRRKSALPPPDMPPSLTIAKSGNGFHAIGFADTSHPGRRGRPRGATHLLLMRYVGEEPIADWTRAQFQGLHTRKPVRVNYAAADAGRVATYFAAWVTSTGEQSGWSVPVSMMIAGVARIASHEAGRTELKMAA